MKLQKKRKQHFARTANVEKERNRNKRNVPMTVSCIFCSFIALFLSVCNPFFFIVVFANYCTIRKKKLKDWSDMNVNDLFCTVYGTQVKCMQTNRSDDTFKRKLHFYGCHVTYAPCANQLTTYTHGLHCDVWMIRHFGKTTSKKIYRLLSGMTSNFSCWKFSKRHYRKWNLIISEFQFLKII